MSIYDFQSASLADAFVGLNEPQNYFFEGGLWLVTKPQTDFLISFRLVLLGLSTLTAAVIFQHIDNLGLLGFRQFGEEGEGENFSGQLFRYRQLTPLVTEVGIDGLQVQGNRIVDH